MSVKYIKKIAQNIIEQTAHIVAPNTVNLMDENGIIIASSDEKRIGTFHSGAYKAIIEKNEVNIYPNEIKKFEGAKQGVNIPIIKKNKVVAVIGIFGNPNEIKKTAYLLSISTSLFLDQNDYMKREQRRIELRNNLSEVILSKNCENEINEIIEALSISFSYPLKPIVFNFNEQKPKYEVINKELYDNNFISNKKDILIEYPSYYILLKSNCNKNINFGSFINFLKKINTKNIVFGKNIKSICDLSNSIKIAKAMMLLPYEREYYDCMNYDDLALLAFDYNSRDWLNEYYKSIISILDNETSYWIYQTIEEYINKNGKIQSISNTLNIHKNTCIYRINKILRLCNLQNCNSFTISYFFRAIMHIKKTSINRDL